MAKAPSKRQLEILRGLCADTGERYYRPKTSKQAQARIYLLAGIKKGTIKVRRIGSDSSPSSEAAKPEPLPRARRDACRFEELPALFAQLKRAHYTLARRMEHGEGEGRLPKKIAQLECQIDEIVEAPSG